MSSDLDFSNQQTEFYEICKFNLTNYHQNTNNEKSTTQNQTQTDAKTLKLIESLLQDDEYLLNEKDQKSHNNTIGIFSRPKTAGKQINFKPVLEHEEFNMSENQLNYNNLTNPNNLNNKNNKIYNQNLETNNQFFQRSPRLFQENNIRQLKSIKPYNIHKFITQTKSDTRFFSPQEKAKRTPDNSFIRVNQIISPTENKKNISSDTLESQNNNILAPKFNINYNKFSISKMGENDNFIEQNKNIKIVNKSMKQSARSYSPQFRTLPREKDPKSHFYQSKTKTSSYQNLKVNFQFQDKKVKIVNIKNKLGREQISQMQIRAPGTGLAEKKANYCKKDFYDCTQAIVNIKQKVANFVPFQNITGRDKDLKFLGNKAHENEKLNKPSRKDEIQKLREFDLNFQETQNNLKEQILLSKQRLQNIDDPEQIFNDLYQFFPRTVGDYDDKFQDKLLALIQKQRKQRIEQGTLKNIYNLKDNNNDNLNYQN